MIRTVFWEDRLCPIGGGQNRPRRVRRGGPAQGRLGRDDSRGRRGRHGKNCAGCGDGLDPGRGRRRPQEAGSCGPTF